MRLNKTIGTFLIISIIMLFSCSKANLITKLEGKWALVMLTGDQVNAPEFEFLKDGFKVVRKGTNELKHFTNIDTIVFDTTTYVVNNPTFGNPAITFGNNNYRDLESKTKWIIATLNTKRLVLVSINGGQASKEFIRK